MAFLDKFQHTTRIKRLNLGLQILLALAAILAVNYLSMRHFTRVDLTGRHVHSLSPETHAYLGEISEPVRFIVTIPREATNEDDRILFDYVHNLLREYDYAAAAAGAADRVSIEYVDVYKELARARELAETYGLDRANAVVVASGDRKRILGAEAFLEMRDGEPVAYTGEQAVTSAIIEVAHESRPKLYFVTGHNEMAPANVSPDRGLSLLTEALRQRNFDVATLDLSQAAGIPDDAGMIFIVDPQGPFLPREQERLRAYLHERAGRVVLFLSPARDHGLDDMLFEWGLRADDMLVIERDPNYIDSAGSFLIRQFAEHPITSVLLQNSTYLLGGLSRPVRPDPGAPIEERLQVTPLMGSSGASWAERAYRDAATASFDAATDLPGPVTIGAVAERRASSQLGINVPGGRLVVFGTGDLIANRRITTLGNFNLVLGTINWALDRTRMVAIPPRPIERNQLLVSRNQLKHTGLWFLVVPGAVALIGIAVHWYRKI